MSNPYQAFFDKLDATIADLEVDGGIEQTHKDAADLLKRAGYVLANQLNMQAQVYVHLFLDPPTVEAETEDIVTPEAQPEGSARSAGLTTEGSVDHADEAPDASPDAPPASE